MYLKLFKKNRPIKLVELTLTFLPDNTPYISIPSELSAAILDSIEIFAPINNMNDLVGLGTLLHQLENRNINNVKVILPYVPGYTCTDSSTLYNADILQVVINMINTFPYSEIVTLDNLSEITSNMLKKCTNLTNHSIVYQIIMQLNRPITLVAPNIRMYAKTTALHAYLDVQNGIEITDCIFCTQKQQADNIIKINVLTEDLTDKTCLVVSDVCTSIVAFEELAKQLYKKKAKELFLIISHGVFLENIEELKQYYTQIYVTNSRTINNTNVELITI